MAADDALLAVCRTTYRRVMDATGDVEMVQLALPQDLQRAGVDVDRDSPELTFGLSDVLVVLADGRSVHRHADGIWRIDRDTGADKGTQDGGQPT
jgi:hypothetical protein